MKKAQIVKYFCTTDGWVSSNPCLRCDKPTAEKVLPARRGNMYYLHDIDHPVPSVTSVLQVLAKPQLIPWAARTAAAFAFENPSSSIEEASASIYGVKKRAGNRGTDVHDLIVSGQTENIPPEYAGYLEAYKKFCEAVPHTVVLREKIVYTETYAGRFDAYIKSGEKFYLIDYKTSSDLYPETGLQLSAYKHAVWMEEKMGEKGKPWNVRIDGLMGVRLGDDGTFATKEYKDNIQVFDALLEIYNWQKNG